MSHKLRIALFHNLPSGGAKRAVYEWVRRLAPHHEIHTFTLSTSDHAFCDIRPLVKEHIIYDFQPRILFSRRGTGRLNHYQRWRTLKDMMALGERIARDIDRRNYDVVFANPCQFTLIPALLHYVNTPSIYYLHEPFGPTFIRSVERPYGPGKWGQRSRRLDPTVRLYGNYLDKVRRTSLMRTTILLANSQFTRDEMHRQYTVDSYVCYLGVDSDKFYPVSALEKELAVLSVGEITARKGFDFLVHSLGQIPGRMRPELRLVANWIDENELAYLESLARDRHVNLNVQYRLDTEQLRTQYNRARLTLYAPIMEPFGLVPLESMACGTPVVGVNEAGIRETVKHGVTGLLAEREPQEFASAIEALLRDESRRHTYGSQARSYVEEEWCWERSVSLIERQLRRVASDETD